MLKTIFTTCLLFICLTTVVAQEKEPERDEVDRLTDSVMAEGKALFRSEWASWHGSDIFMEKCKNKEGLIRGYLSYETPENLVNLFYSKGDKPVTLGVITFGKDFDKEKYRLDTIPRALIPVEQSLAAMRASALKTLRSDTTFKSYKNTTFNVIPFINNGVKRIYVLTATTQLYVVALGNDYLLDVNTKNEVSSIKRIHNSLIATNTKESNAQTLMHTHLVGKDETISATDICTLMLYEKENNLKQAYVMSKKYISIWDCEKDELLVLTKQAWDRINAHQKEKKDKQ